MNIVGDSYFDDALTTLPTDYYAAPQATGCLNTTWLDFASSYNSLDLMSDYNVSVTTESTDSSPRADFAEPSDSINHYPSPPHISPSESNKSPQVFPEFGAKSKSKDHRRWRSADKTRQRAPTKDVRCIGGRGVGNKSVESKSTTNGERVRARNRVAASKCRDKKGAYNHQLQEEMLNLETKHRNLFAELSDLKDELFRLKVLLMAHAGCNDGNIDLWMKVEVHKFIDKKV